MKRKGFFYISSNEVEAAIQWYQEQGYTIFTLPNNMRSGNDFFDGVRATLPLDQPLTSNNWDALNDSLWSGLDELPEKNVLLVWRNAYYILINDLKSFNIIKDIFSTLPDELYSGNQKFGIEFNLVILVVA